MNNIECPIKNHSINTPNDIALIDGKLELSYLELDKKIDTVLADLGKKGVKNNMRVGIISENTLQYVILIFAILRLGGIVVPINFRFRFKEIEKIISGIEINLVISDMFEKEFFLSKTKIYKFSDFPFDQVKKNNQTKKESFADGKTIILTSGSTGIPKGILLSVENHYYNAIGSNINIVLKKSDKWLLSLPLFHVGGIAILFRVFIAGITVSLTSHKHVNIGKEIDHKGISHASMVHTQINRYISYLENKKEGISEKLKMILIGGSYIPESIVKKCINFKIPIYKTYGLTEMSSQVTTTNKAVNKSDLSTSGSVLKFRELSIGCKNKIYVRGKTLFLGYISDRKFLPVHTDNDGWFNTGDVGFLNDSRELYVMGREDNMFVSGGENIFPEEIEAALINIEFINDAVVVAISNEEYGKRPVAFIKCNNNISSKDISKKLLDILPKFKIPDKYYVLEDMETQGIKRNTHHLMKMAETGEAVELFSD